MKPEEDKLKLEEIKGHLRLAKIFLDVANKRKKSKNEGEIRLAIDVGYNSAEHCLKAFILLNQDTIPRRHSGIAQRFSELYIKEGEFEKALSKKVRLCLKFRNLARYDPKASVGKIMVNEVLTLAEELTTLLEAEISQN